MSKSYFYKGVRVNAFGIPTSLIEKSRVKKKDRKRKFYYITFESPFEKNSAKNLIIIYDIPEEKKKERNWFRRQLKSFGYIMIQRSVWVGPSPLPKAFVDYVKMIGIKNNLKTFKLVKSYNDKKE